VLFCNSGCIHSDYGEVRHKVHRWRFHYFYYSFDVLVSWSHKLSLYSWFCMYSVLLALSILSILWYFLSLGDNSGYMNSGYGDVWYTVYIWGFPCLDYSFDVLISRIGNLGLYNWFYNIYFTCYLFTCSFMLMLTTRFSIHALWLRFIDTHVLIYTRYLAFTTPLVGEFWLSWTCMFRSRSSELVDSSCCWLETQRMCGSPADRLKPIFSGPPARLPSFPFVTREHLLYCS